MKQTIIKRDAADQKAGMTFAELEEFVQAASVTPFALFAASPVKIRTTWRGTIKSAQITIEHDEN